MNGPDCHELEGYRTVMDYRSGGGIETESHRLTFTNISQHGSPTNYGDACLCASHPCVRDAIFFHWIVSQHCCFMTVGIVYC